MPTTATILSLTENTQAKTAPLASILECPDLSVDACVVDKQTHELIFISVWGRDTAVQQLLARLTLDSTAAESLKSGIGLKIGPSTRPVFFHDTDKLEKRTSREYPGTLFGSLLNLWLFHPQCTVPDSSQHSAYVLLQTPKAQQEADPASSRSGDWPQVTRARLASALLNLAPFPILPEWADVALDEVQKQQMLSQQETLFGDVLGYRLNLDVDRLEQAISDLIRSDQLTAGGQPLRP